MFFSLGGFQPLLEFVAVVEVVYVSFGGAGAAPSCLQHSRSLSSSLLPVTHRRHPVRQALAGLVRILGSGFSAGSFPPSCSVMLAIRAALFTETMSAWAGPFTDQVRMVDDVQAGLYVGIVQPVRRGCALLRGGTRWLSMQSGILLRRFVEPFTDIGTPFRSLRRPRRSPVSRRMIVR